MLFSPFFTRDFRFRGTRECTFPSPGGATVFAKLQSKIAKTPKIGTKVCIESRKILTKSHCSRLGPINVDVQLCKDFSASRYIALVAKVTMKVLMGSPKMAWSEQVCAHQKSYKK